MNRTVDTVIIGAGPAGSCAAALLARQGFDVLVVERDSFPRFAIGESLLPQCMDLLQEAGLLAAVETANFQIKRGALFRYQDKAAHFDFREQAFDGWSYTYQVPRADFDQILADGAQQVGAEILFEHVVDDLVFDADGVSLNLRRENGDPITVHAQFVLDASGFGRVLARKLDLERPSTFPCRASLFTHVRGDLGDPLVGRDSVVAGIHPVDRHIWYWAIPFADGRTSVGIVADPKFFAQYSRNPEDRLRTILLQEPNMARRLPAMECLFPPRYIEGYTHSVSTLYGDRFALLGNAGEFLDPVFASGLTIALKSASLAAAALSKQLRNEYVDWQSEFSDPLLSGVSVFETYVRSWYDLSFQHVIFHDEKVEDIKAKICPILAGYVWNEHNTFVTQDVRSLRAVTELCAPLSPETSHRVEER